MRPWREENCIWGRLLPMHRLVNIFAHRNAQREWCMPSMSLKQIVKQDALWFSSTSRTAHTRGAEPAIWQAGLCCEHIQQVFLPWRGSHAACTPSRCKCLRKRVFSFACRGRLNSEASGQAPLGPECRIQEPPGNRQAVGTELLQESVLQRPSSLLMNAHCREEIGYFTS